MRRRHGQVEAAVVVVARDVGGRDAAQAGPDRGDERIEGARPDGVKVRLARAQCQLDRVVTSGE